MGILVQPVKVNGIWLCFTQLPFPATTDYRKTPSEKTQPSPMDQTAPTGEGIASNKWIFDGGAGDEFNGVVYAGIVGCTSNIRIHVDGTYEDDGSDVNGLVVTHNGVLVAGSGHNLFTGGYYGLAVGSGPTDVSQTVDVATPAERPCGHIIYASAVWGPDSGNASNFEVWIEVDP
ncbi:MAG: hypothetical protein AAGB14_01735 [Verrucomicrobiota bacterium]